MAAKKTQKDLAQRIDPTYFRRAHPLRRTRFWLSAGIAVAAAAWLAGAWALGNEAVYSNGDVSRAHLFIEQDCAKCHTETFSHVPESACRECHDLGAHVPVEKGADPVCTSCHVEHKGRDFLHFVDDGHCNACHTDHKGVQDLASHVEFKIEPRDQHLRFNHAAHLTPDLIDGPLDCAACHQPSESGKHFAPVRFAAHCARCHTDRLDGNVPAPVPHGLQPEALADWANGAYLSAMRANGELAAEPSNPMPGAGATRVPPWADTIKRRTEVALQTLLTPGRKQGCLLCHEMVENKFVAPEVPTNWYPQAYFNHKSHRFVSCDRCHDMSKSTDAMSLELPKVANCRDCHNEGGAGDTCVTCHPFHPPR